MFNPPYHLANTCHNRLMILLVLTIAAVVISQLAAANNRNRYDRDRK